MIYPQLLGEPNFILIGVSAVFGLLVIIMVYYIFVSKNPGSGNLYSQDLSKQMAQGGAGTPGTPGNQMLNGSTMGSASTMPTIPVPINSGGYYSPTPTGPLQSNPKISQVFNVKENIYTLDDAAGVCGALGADLASVNQLIDAHRQGADWCNVGWTSDGLAAYPIQYSTWKTLQDNDPNNRNICGAPGINLARNDPNLLYGVNCYGVKPEPKGNEKVKNVVISDKQVALNAKIAAFQKNINNIGIVPFNPNKWSE